MIRKRHMYMYMMLWVQEKNMNIYIEQMKIIWN